MVKRIKKTVKNRPTRERRKLVVVGTEGNNKTEELYFKELEKIQSKFHFIFAKGNETDPVKIVRNTANRAKIEELSYKDGDKAVSVFDLDLDTDKIPQLIAAKNIADKKNVTIYPSNPCFEVWYLEHFEYTSKLFHSSNEVIRELEKYLPNYKKNYCDFDILYPRTENAIDNCKKLDKHHRDVGTNTSIEFANPSTSIHTLIEVLMEKQN